MSETLTVRTSSTLIELTVPRSLSDADAAIAAITGAEIALYGPRATEVAESLQRSGVLEGIERALSNAIRNLERELPDSSEPAESNADAFRNLERHIPDSSEPAEFMDNHLLNELASNLKNPTYFGGPTNRIDWHYAQGREARRIFLEGGDPDFRPPGSQFVIKWHVAFASCDELFYPFASKDVTQVKAVARPRIIGHFYTRAEAMAFASGIGRVSLPNEI